MWDGDGPLVDLAQSVHLLHVLPVAPTKDARTRLVQLDVINPQLSGVDVNADLIKNELISLDDSLTTLAILVVGQIEATSNEVDVR